MTLTPARLLAWAQGLESTVTPYDGPPNESDLLDIARELREAAGEDARESTGVPDVARCAELEGRVRELEAQYQCVSCRHLETRLAALTEAAREAVAVLTNHDRTTHRGLQWAYDLAAKLRAALEDGK
jgi:hypothetical protein